MTCTIEIPEEKKSFVLELLAKHNITVRTEPLGKDPYEDQPYNTESETYQYLAWAASQPMEVTSPGEPMSLDELFSAIEKERTETVKA